MELNGRKYTPETAEDAQLIRDLFNFQEKRAEFDELAGHPITKGNVGNSPYLIVELGDVKNVTAYMQLQGLTVNSK